MKVNKTTLAVFCAINTISFSSLAADARSQGMGNTGVATSEYYLAAFHNPALGAHFGESDDFAVLLPSVRVGLHDQDEVIQTIDDANDVYDRLDEQFYANPNDAKRLSQYMDDLDGTAPIKVDAGLNFVVAIPSKAISASLFANAYTEVIATTMIAPKGSSYDSTKPLDVTDRFDESQVKFAAFGMSEFGLSFSKEFLIYGQDISFGISPKYQQLLTYAAQDAIEDFDIDDYEDSEVSDSAFNVDLGMAWKSDAWRAGLVAKNLISNEISTSYSNSSVGNYTYELKPEVALGLGYSNQFFTAALDVDLTKKTRFKELDDDTQFVRVGIEGNAWGWAQLRAGYELDLQDTLDNSITAGIGISPFDTVGLDIAGSYAGEGQFGASASLAFTF